MCSAVEEWLAPLPPSNNILVLTVVSPTVYAEFALSLRLLSNCPCFRKTKLYVQFLENCLCVRVKQIVGCLYASTLRLTDDHSRGVFRLSLSVSLNLLAESPDQF